MKTEEGVPLSSTTHCISESKLSSPVEFQPNFKLTSKKTVEISNKTIISNPPAFQTYYLIMGNQNNNQQLNNSSR
jgi:hypothetical protein